MAAAVVIRKSTGEILNYNYNVLDPSQAIQGLDPDLEVLLKTEPYPVPDYDSRIFQLLVIDDITTDPHPEFNLYNQYRRTYQTQKRSNEEIELAARNAESNANESLFNTNEQFKLLALSVAALIRFKNGVQWGAREIAVTNLLVDKAVKMFKNDEELQRKINEITAGTEPNLDEGWESEE